MSSRVGHTTAAAYWSAAPTRTSSGMIGVLASQPFHHHGLNAPYVDISRETVTVNTASYGRCYPVEQADAQLRSATEDTIADLDKVIAELTAHRDRLAAELSVDGQGGDRS
jgi:hypothetical protein